MVDKVINGIISALSFLSAGLFLLVIEGIFLVFGIIYFFKKNKHRILLFSVRFSFLFLLLLSVLLTEKSHGITDKIAIMVLFLAQFLFFLSFGVKSGDKQDKKDYIATHFVKDLEEKIEEEKIIAKEKTNDCLDDDRLNQPVIKEDVNFTHVLNVIEKLNYFNLNREEKIHTNELKRMCIDFASGKDESITKREINEKLSHLLRIMSKYNV